MFADDYNPLPEIFGLIGRKIDADAQSRTWRQQQLYGVNEDGRPYFRGTASQAIAPGVLGSPLVMVGVGILAVALVVWAIKS